MCTVQRHGVKNVFDVGPRLMLFDGIDGIAPYITIGFEYEVYLIADDGRLLRHSSDGVINLIEPNRNLAQDGSAKVCSRHIVWQHFDGQESVVYPPVRWGGVYMSL